MEHWLLHCLLKLPFNTLTRAAIFSVAKFGLHPPLSLEGLSFASLNCFAPKTCTLSPWLLTLPTTVNEDLVPFKSFHVEHWWPQWWSMPAFAFYLSNIASGCL